MMVNSPSAQSLRLADDRFTLLYNDANIKIQRGHCPVWAVATPDDTLAILPPKQNYHNALLLAGIDSTLRIHAPGGGHNWADWTALYYDEMIAWLAAH
jgi:S-formylglutathione hydrolase FrmB